MHTVKYNVDLATMYSHAYKRAFPYKKSYYVAK